MKRVTPLLIISVLLTAGCGMTRTHVVTRDDSGLRELEGTIGSSDVTMYSGRGVYRDVEITSVSSDSITFVGENGSGSLATKIVYRIENEKSGWGIVLGALGGAIGGVMIGGPVGNQAGDAGGTTLVTVSVAVLGSCLGAALGNALDQDDVYTLEEPRK